MANIIFAKMTGKLDPLFGKFEHPLKALIMNESNQYEKNRSVIKELFNVEKSNRYAETTMGQTDFGTFKHKGEGQGVMNDSVGLTFKKTIEHVSYGSGFVVTKEMADDSTTGLCADMKNVARGMARGYHKTKDFVAAQALINGTNATMRCLNTNIDLTTGDGLALFHAAHPFADTDKMGNRTQSNLFRGDISSSERQIENALGTFANIMRNFEDENGGTMGYTANVIIIPCNRSLLEQKMKRVVGTARNEGAEYINTQDGNWTLIVLDGWRTTDDRYMIMSSEANKVLRGNMFYNRTDLTIRSWIDDNTFDYCWSCFCRFGVGFNTWKHILLAVDSAATGNSNIGTAVPELAYAAS